VAIYRRRRRRGPIGPGLILSSASAFVIGVWWLYLRADVPASVRQAANPPAMPALISTRPEVVPETPPPEVAEKGETPDPPKPSADPAAGQRAASLVATGKQALERGDWLAARSYLSEAFVLGTVEPDRSLLQAELTRIGNETIFSPRMAAGDPFAERYVVQPGDSLAKVAKTYKVSSDLLANINEIKDKNLIRAGQAIKVIKGPFHAVVDKSDFSLDVYLGKTFVKHFKVGLGADGSTPTGVWRVGNKLKNPTYYPPRGGKVIAADDPANPLGERWIGLEGVSGEAVGQLRYGVHGTIEPDSIGRSVSMGCLRMYNEDVEALYSYLIEGDSTITVRD